MLLQTAAQPGQHMARGSPSTTTSGPCPSRGNGSPQWKHCVPACASLADGLLTPGAEPDGRPGHARAPATGRGRSRPCFRSCPGPEVVGGTSAHGAREVPGCSAPRWQPVGPGRLSRGKSVARRIVWSFEENSRRSSMRRTVQGGRNSPFRGRAVLRAREKLERLLRAPSGGYDVVVWREYSGRLDHQTPSFSRHTPCLARQPTRSRRSAIHEHPLSPTGC